MTRYDRGKRGSQQVRTRAVRAAISQDHSPTGRVRRSVGPVGLVLSGGGVRGAYEAGVISGIVEALDRRPSDPSPFQILAGSSIGAIHAAFIASHAERGDLSLRKLEDAWRSLELKRHIRLRPLRILRTQRERHTAALLDAAPIEELVHQIVPFSRIRENVCHGRVRALFVSTLQIATGRTVLFSEMGPQSSYVSTRDTRRKTVRTKIESEHVLASSALPLLFPARRIQGRYYCDGGLRFNTPIAPVIRAGADRLVIVAPFEPFQTIGAPGSLRRTTPPPVMEDYPTLSFLMGKLLDVLLLDPILYDLQLLDRYNQLVTTLEGQLPDRYLAQVNMALVQARGVPYRRIETLLFTPSRDLAGMAAARLRALAKSSGALRVLRSAVRGTAPWRQADWISYLLFDGEYAAALIELGRGDALARADEIRAFFRTGKALSNAKKPSS